MQTWAGVSKLSNDIKPGGGVHRPPEAAQVLQHNLYRGPAFPLCRRGRALKAASGHQQGPIDNHHAKMDCRQSEAARVNLDCWTAGTAVSTHQPDNSQTCKCMVRQRLACSVRTTGQAVAGHPGEYSSAVCLQLGKQQRRVLQQLQGVGLQSKHTVSREIFKAVYVIHILHD